MAVSRSPWSADRDEAFFRLVRGLFPPASCDGATALLMSYDDEAPADRPARPVPLPAQVPAPHVAQV